MAKDMFLILSLKHSEGTKPCFWRSDDAGYTTLPWNAGVYTKQQVEANPKYYNNGYDTIAIPFTNGGIESIGFKCTIDLEKVRGMARSVRILRTTEEEINNG